MPIKPAPFVLSVMKKHPRIILAIIIAVHLANLSFWHAQNTIPSGHSAMEVGGDAVCWKLFLARLGSPADLLRHLFYPDSKTPPLFFWLFTLASRFTDSAWAAIHGVPAFAFALLLTGVYLLAKQIASPQAGLTAAAAAGFYPVFFGFAHTANTSVLAAAFEILAVAFLLKSKNLTEKRSTIYAALCVALALLSERGTPAIVLAAPLAVVSFKAFQTRIRNARRGWALSIVFYLIPLIIAGPYLISYTRAFVFHNIQFIGRDYYNLGDTYPYGNQLWAFYLIEIFRTQIGGLLFFAFLGGVIAAIRQKVAHAGFLCAAICAPIIVFSFIATKDMSYDFGVLPFMAVLTAAGITSIDTPSRRCAAIVIFLLGAAVSYAFVYIPPVQSVALASPASPLFVTPKAAPYNDPRKGATFAQAADLLEKLAKPGQIIALATPAGWQPSDYDRALAVELAARRPDCRILLAKRLPGSDDKMVVCTPAEEIPIERLRRLDEYLPGPCIGDFIKTGNPPILTEILDGVELKTVATQSWEDHPVVIGVFSTH